MKRSECVKANFKRRLSKAIKCHAELMLAVHNKLNQAALETMLVEQFVMLSSVQWESFLNDLIIAYVLMRPGTALQSLEQRIEKSVQGKFGTQAVSCLTFKVRKPVTRQRIAGLLDPKDWNITVGSGEELSTKANDLLSAEFAKRFSLDKDDAQFIEFGVALRNFLGHRSDGARAELKAAIQSLSEPKNVCFRAVKLGDVGTYLKAKTPAGITRAVACATRLMEIAEKL
ncbi:MAG: hypothetical protein NT105_15560 [Verrucomicrobia bacterium]|nr:hypothetical protein [Verrucomicrobiota bacterium]